ncbi:MAG: outer membrane beta-barrel protein [Candidatus Zixiibacteriota bacterium]
MRIMIPIVVLSIILASVSFGQDAKFGVGGFGGLILPAVMDDQGNGTVFGLKARIKIMPLITAEPNITFGKWGEPDPIDGFNPGIDGSKINSYGVDATFGNSPGVIGFKPYGVLGAAIYSIKNDDTGFDESKLGWSIGLGFGFGFSPQFDLDIRGKANVALQENGSKKALYITAGLNYYFKTGE